MIKWLERKINEIWWRIKGSGSKLILVLLALIFGFLAAYGVGVLSLKYVVEHVYFRYIFWSIAFAWSTFLGAFAYILHDTTDYKLLPWSRRCHQFIFNFSGSFVGWLVLYLLLTQNDILAGFRGWEKIILFAISFIGINGYLPYISVKHGIPGK